LAFYSGEEVKKKFGLIEKEIQSLTDVRQKTVADK